MALRAPKLKNRHGFALVLMAVMLSLALVAAAFSTDIGRMYVVRAQLQAGADAAALAGVFEQGAGRGASARDTAQKYLRTFPAMGLSNVDTSLARDSIGSWIAGAFIADASQDWTHATNDNLAAGGEPNDAVKVVAKHTVSFTFGRIMGYTTRTVSATAVAAWGAATSSTCVRPWAIPYQQLLDVLYPPAGTKTTAYVLTPADIQSLSAMTYAGNPVALKVGSSGGFAPNGQFYATRVPPGEYADGSDGDPWTGGSNYGNAVAAASCSALAALIRANTSATNISVGVGDWLDPESGNKEGPTRQGIDDLCGSDNCSPPYRIIAALWDTFGNSPGGHCSGCYHVKYLGEFSIDHFEQSSKTVFGFFNTMTLPASGSTFTAGGTSSLMIRALVK